MERIAKPILNYSKIASSSFLSYDGPRFPIMTVFHSFLLFHASSCKTLSCIAFCISFLRDCRGLPLLFLWNGTHWKNGFGHLSSAFYLVPTIYSFSYFYGAHAHLLLVIRFHYYIHRPNFCSMHQYALRYWCVYYDFNFKFL